MQITQALAEKIVQKTRELTRLNINVMDRDGMIIASSDPKRINTFHEGAYKVIQSGSEILISTDNYIQWAGSKPGMNMPICFKKEIVGVIGISGSPDEVVPFGRAVTMMTEMMLQQASLMEQLEWEERAKNYLVQDMITGTLPASLDSVLARGKLLGIDLSLPRSIMILQLSGHEQTVTDFAQDRHAIKRLSAFFRNPEQVLVSFVKRDRLIVVTELSTCKQKAQIKRYLDETAQKISKSFRETMNLEVKIALGTSSQHPYELANSYQGAMKVLDALMRFPEKGDVRYYEDIALELVLADVSEPSRTVLIANYLGELKGSPELIDTLRALYLCDMNLSVTAQKLNVHRNTLLYRLAKIEELLGFNPRRFNEAVGIQLALLLQHYEEKAGD
ncbi:CdaR family transcriptional regulator [Brevibacillus migulae]|uniref:CdaR family transcriptional regulator n=1 Tax=Brevibacillus migulae TaxID=1644114 RepID=UPI00106EE2AD|nr:sugar diacid recognition domain-containing protein [Brevibacillus migulae]